MDGRLYHKFWFVVVVFDGYYVSNSNDAIAFMDEILPEINIIITAAVGGQGFERLFGPGGGFWVDGGYHAAGAELYTVKIDVANGEIIDLIFLKGLAAGEYDVGAETDDG